MKILKKLKNYDTCSAATGSVAGCAGRKVGIVHQNVRVDVHDFFI